MRLEYWIARRYIFARRSLQFISVITLLSLTGITVGVAAIICVSSIFNGFREVYQSMMMAFDPHLRVIAAKGAHIEGADSLLSYITKHAGVKGASPVISGRAVMTGDGKMQIAELQAVRLTDFTTVSGVQSSIIVGTFVKDVPGALPQIAVGAEMAANANIMIDDTVQLLSPSFIEDALQSLVQPQGIRCTVCGIFYTNSKEYNSRYAFCSSATGMQLFNLGPAQYSSIDIRLSSPAKAEEIKSDLVKFLPSSVTVETWYDLHKNLYGVMEFERYASFVILSVIVLVSVFNIFAMLTMTIVKKRTDIGLMQALGADVRVIQRIFLTEGLVIGIIGTVSGLILGLSLCYAQMYFHLFQFDPQSFIIPAIPVTIAWTDVVGICILTIAFSFLATIYPARRAAQTVIAKAIRTE